MNPYMLGAAAAVAVCVSACAPDAQVATTANPKGHAVAMFAGGCFWCVESDFDKVPGVVRTASGYSGGETENPSYRQVSAGGTGHLEAVQIVYDPQVVSYEELLHTFWRSVDPTDAGGQFCDRGESYTTAVFVGSEEERRLAFASKEAVEDALGQSIATSIEFADTFYRAEDYHQDYYQKNPLRYHYYRYLCGRDARVQELWGEEAHSGIL